MIRASRQSIILGGLDFPQRLRRIREAVPIGYDEWNCVGKFVMMGDRCIATCSDEPTAQLMCELSQVFIPLTNLLVMMDKRLRDVKMEDEND